MTAPAYAASLYCWCCESLFRGSHPGRIPPCLPPRPRVRILPTTEEERGSKAASPHCSPSRPPSLPAGSRGRHSMVRACSVPRNTCKVAPLLSAGVAMPSRQPATPPPSAPALWALAGIFRSGRSKHPSAPFCISGSPQASGPSSAQWGRRPPPPSRPRRRRSWETQGRDSHTASFQGSREGATSGNAWSCRVVRRLPRGQTHEHSWRSQQGH
mmetsp:Transcript_6057/g.13300  ORF Transcript_6057/g.13300 Transcript_6057/m.13300 type:complete len:213 (-) Transcript_6057:422-1060(-)